MSEPIIVVIRYLPTGAAESDAVRGVFIDAETFNEAAETMDWIIGAGRAGSRINWEGSKEIARLPRLFHRGRAALDAAKGE